MGWLKEIFSSRTKDWFFSQLPVAPDPNFVLTKIIPADAEYVSIILKSMRIVNVRKGLSKFYATVHSHIEVPYLTGKPACFNYVTTPGTLEKLDGAHIDRVVNLNRRLLGPIPYRGADIKLEIGLFSIKEADLAAPFISLLTSMSSLGGVSFINTALPYIEPLEKGIELLTGSGDDTILEIGINTELNIIKTGYYVVIRAEKDSINVGDLKIDKNDFRLLDKNNVPIKDYPYMVFEISSIPNRDDWFNIPEISDSYNKLQEQVRKGKTEDVSNALTVFKLVVLTSPDLLLRDGKIVYKKVEDEIKEIFATTPTSRTKSYQLKDLKEFTLQ
jgi:hypothetical protein